MLLYLALELLYLAPFYPIFLLNCLIVLYHSLLLYLAVSCFISLMNYAIVLYRALPSSIVLYFDDELFYFTLSCS